MAMFIDEHPLPKIEEIFNKMVFNDLSKAYLHLNVHPDDQRLLTLTTHKGLYQPTC